MIGIVYGLAVIGGLGVLAFVTALLFGRFTIEHNDDEDLK